MIRIPNNKTIIVFSDTHFTNTFNKKIYANICKIIHQADVVIINGDFWDSSYITFSEFVDSEWNKLFPLLKQKKTYYIFGNHDLRHLSDNRVQLFSDIQTEELTFQNAGQIFHVHHGHWLLPRTAAIVRLFKNRPKLLSFITWPLDIVGAVHHYFIRKGFQLIASINNGFLTYKVRHLKSNEYLITGHTHAPYVDHVNKYINTGYFFQGFGSWIEIKQGIVKLHTSIY